MLILILIYKNAGVNMSGYATNAVIKELILNYQSQGALHPGNIVI